MGSHWKLVAKKWKKKIFLFFFCIFFVFFFCIFFLYHFSFFLKDGTGAQIAPPDWPCLILQLCWSNRPLAGPSYSQLSLASVISPVVTRGISHVPSALGLLSSRIRSIFEQNQPTNERMSYWREATNHPPAPITDGLEWPPGSPFFLLTGPDVA